MLAQSACSCKRRSLLQQAQAAIRWSNARGCVIGVAATSVWLKEFWRYDARTDEHAVRERALRSDGAPAGPEP